MANLQDLTVWAVPRVSNLLPLPEDELQQLVSYAATLSTAQAVANHFTDLLGSSAECLSFIEEFNRRRFPSSAASRTPGNRTPRQDDTNAPPRSHRAGKKKKEPLNKLPPVRKVDNPFSSSSENLGAKAYQKEDLSDYMSTSRPKPTPPTSAPASKPTSQVPSRSTTPNPPPAHKQQQPKQQGTLTSDLLNVPTKKKAAKPNTVSIPTGQSMRPPSSTLSDISSALRSLEIHTNPTLANTAYQDPAKRRCICYGKKHDLLLAAPNCLNCGKIICIKEGLAPCTFCGHDLLPAEDMEVMRRVLREEQGKEKMNANNAAHKKVETTKSSGMYASKVNPSAGEGFSSGTSTPQAGAGRADQAALSNAMAHRDKLLGFQSTSAQRTRIIDQAADWETPDFGTNIWATPQERALQLREQQKKMRELEWDTKEDWEKRNVVVSIDLKGKRAIREMKTVERPKFEVEPEDPEDLPVMNETGNNSGGTFSKNPLLTKGLIKPRWSSNDESKDAISEDEDTGQWTDIIRSGWRRVQDDMVDNESYILDGGRLGAAGEVEKSVEPACG